MAIGRFCDGVSRRDALRVGVIGGLGLTLSNFLRLAAAGERPATADSVIFIHLQGGPAHLDTLDMKPDGPVEERGEFKPIQSKLPGLVVCEHLPRLAQAIDQFTLVRGISHSAGAHPQANSYLFTGNRPSPAVLYPSLGSVAIKERPVPPELPGFVAIPNSEMNPGYLGVAYSPFKTTAVPKPGKPFEVRGLSLAAGLTIDKVNERQRLLADLDQTFRQFDTKSQLLEGMDRFGQTAHAMLLSSRARDAFDVAREPASIDKLFAADDLSQSLLLASRLVESGVRFVTVNSGAWDTHLDNFKSLKDKLLPPLDAGVPALIGALSAKGLLDRTLVVVTGEFGRTPTINKNAGRDHWPRTMWTLLAGGGVKAGHLVGASDAKGHGPADGVELKPDDLAATIYHALGIDPLHEYYTKTGRPVLLAQHGRVIEDVFE